MDARLALATEGLFLFGALLMAASHRVRPLPRYRVRADWLKFAVYLATIHTLLFSARLGRAYAALLLAGIWIGAVLELRPHRAALPRAMRVIPATPAIALGIGLAHALLPRGQAWFGTFALLVLLVASADSFAQLVGRLWGTRRPFPRLSPGKTVEGLAGGWTAALVVSLTCGFLAPDLSTLNRALVGTLTALAATGGDLIFSAVKRRAHIKDFSGILPGHGGILDRFDSMVLAAPVYYWVRALTHV